MKELSLKIVTLRDLSPSQQAVQGGHALAEFLLHNRATKWRNGTLIYLGVKNGMQLMKLMYTLNCDKEYFVTWREPDLDNQITALATMSNHKAIQKLQVL